MPNVDGLASPNIHARVAINWRRGFAKFLALFAIGMALAWFALRSVDSSIATRHASIAPDRIDFSIAQPTLQPEQVVARQVESMREGVLDADKLIDCYSLATPSNRAQTGPFNNFVELVQAEPYAQLGLCKDYQVGTAVVTEGVAAVLVSLRTRDDRSMAFRFILEKQTEQPYVDCWMTAGVFALGAADLPTPSVNRSAGEGEPGEQSALRQEPRID